MANPRDSRSASTHLRLLLAAFLVGRKLPGVCLGGCACAWGAGVSVRSGTRLRATITGIAEIGRVAGFRGNLPRDREDARLHPPSPRRRGRHQPSICSREAFLREGATCACGRAARQVVAPAVWSFFSSPEGAFFSRRVNLQTGTIRTTSVSVCCGTKTVDERRRRSIRGRVKRRSHSRLILSVTRQ